MFLMQKLLILLLLLSTGCYSQFYAGLAIDPNKAFGIIDNPRTEMDHRGLHFDVEIGLLEEKFGFYLLYGRFEQANYQKLAVGADYFLINKEKLSIGIGSSVSNIWKKKSSSHENVQYLGWLGRLTGIIWIYPEFGLVGHFQYQSRPDLEVRGIVEGKIGFRYILGR